MLSATSACPRHAASERSAAFLNHVEAAEFPCVGAKAALAQGTIHPVEFGSLGDRANDAPLLDALAAFGRRLEGRGATDPTLKADIDHLHARLAEVDTLQSRVLELEERVDFTERLLAQSQQPSRLGAPAQETDR